MQRALQATLADAAPRVALRRLVYAGMVLGGGLAAGVFDDLAAAQASLQPALRTIDPVEGWLDRYDAHYRCVYQPAYAALRTLHHAADAIERAAVEGQQIDRRTKSAASLLQLAHTSGIAIAEVMRRYPRARRLLPTPSEWKKGVAKHAGAQVVLEVSTQPTDTDLSGQVSQIVEKKPDTLIVYSAPKQGVAAVKMLDAQKKKPQIVTSFVLSDPILFKLAGTSWEGTITSAAIRIEKNAEIAIRKK